jgi:hypothetical protein
MGELDLFLTSLPAAPPAEGDYRSWRRRTPRKANCHSALPINAALSRAEARVGLRIKANLVDGERHRLVAQSPALVGSALRDESGLAAAGPMSQPSTAKTLIADAMPMILPPVLPVPSGDKVCRSPVSTEAVGH